jgi:adenylylsulfate kinase-like enzyme
MIIWLFGQPCSGKTTIAQVLKDKREIIGRPHLIDGDEFREIFQNKKYGREGRIDNIRKAVIVAKYMEHCGFTVICSFVTPYKSMRDEIRETLGDVRMIYLDYQGERGRENYHVEDFDIPLSKEENFLHLRTSDLTLDSCISKIKSIL